MVKMDKNRSGFKGRKRQGKENVEINTDEEGNSSMTIDSGDSKFESNAGKDTKLLEGFPSDFPIPDDAELVMANTITEEGKKVIYRSI